MPSPKSSRILVVDDEANARNALADLLRDEEYQVETAADGFKALGKLDDFGPHLLLTDLKMPGMDGIELIAKVKAKAPDCQVLVMTAFGAVETAVEAMRTGASDYLTKPIHFEELLIVIERAMAHRDLRAEAAAFRAAMAKRSELSNIIGSSGSMHQVFQTVEQVAPSKATVLIMGESGTGKELVAGAIHKLSPRRDGPFVRLHCAALAETLLESELFGHERGAFTGAVARKDGRFQDADGGTLFLDEIGEISPAVQVKLLRFLQEQEFERVGGSQTVKVDVRIVAATNRDLKAEVDAGRFREDLFYRLNVVTIEPPPLRERADDIPVLVQHFLAKFAKENGKEMGHFTDDALHALRSYDWPGNVRELENVVERAVVLSPTPLLTSGVLPTNLAASVQRGSTGGPPIPGSTMEEIEKYAILTTLEHTGGSTSQAADVLGISVRKVQYKLQEYRSAPKSKVDVVGKAR